MSETPRQGAVKSGHHIWPAPTFTILNKVPLPLPGPSASRFPASASRPFIQQPEAHFKNANLIVSPPAHTVQWFPTVL